MTAILEYDNIGTPAVHILFWYRASANYYGFIPATGRYISGYDIVNLNIDLSNL